MSFQLAALAGPEGPEADAGLAWQLADQHLQLLPPHRRTQYRGPVLMQVAAVLARAQLPDSARAVIDRAREEDGGQNPETLIQEANARLRLGETDAALSLLGAYLRAKPAEHQKIASDWWWESLYDHPDFQALIAHASE